MYIYSPIPPNSFRLLCMEPPNDFSDMLQCSLKIVSFDNPPTYHCLSYTWGNPFPNGTPQREHYAARDATSSYNIICDGRRFDIGQNLFDALSTLHAVASQELKSFWVDAICINQQDIKERGQQVARMADVYRTADSVIVWLGAEDEHTPTVVETAHILQQSHGTFEEFLNTENPPSNLTQSELFQSFASKVSIQQQEAAIMFLCRPWFSRLWVIQEICLARDIRLFCGHREFSWSNIIHLAHSGVVDRPPCVRNGKMTYLGIDEEYFDRFPSLGRVRGLCILKMLVEEFGLFNFRVYDHHVCDTTRGQYFCSDPRDLIYGLRGICDPAVLQQEPDYEKSTETTFTEFTALSIEFNQDLRILKFVEDSSSRKIKNLPSWVPDFTTKKNIDCLQNLYAHYSLSHNVPAPEIRGEILNISAIKAENVVQVIWSIDRSFFSDLDRFLGFLQSFSRIYPTHENLLHVLVLVLTVYSREKVSKSNLSIANYRVMFFEYIQYNFVSALITGQDSIASQKLIKPLYETLGKFDREDAPLLPQWSQIEDQFHFYDNLLSEQGWEDHAAQLFEFTSRYLHIFVHKLARVFRTSGNYMGIGVPSVRPGDEIWLTPHSNTPLILRPLSARGDDIYEFAGEAYVHGISHGEIVESDPAKFQRIRIA